MIPRCTGVFCVLAFCLFSTHATAAPASPPGHAEITARIAEALPRLEPLYKHLHAHPELSSREEQTAQRVADELEQAGWRVTRRVGGHGVVGVLSNGVGPTA